MLKEQEIEFFLRAVNYGIKCHSDVNHFYGNKPYSYHLNSVYSAAIIFKHLLPEKSHCAAFSACYVHDVIEDARQTYNDVKNALNEEIAEIAYLLTTEKGRTREERANHKYYEGIRANKIATFVKLCDRIANVEDSKNTGSGMLLKYKGENSKFVSSLMPGNEDLLPMFVHLNKLFQDGK